MNALDKARKRARQAQERLYEGKCTIVEYGKTKDPVTKITSSGEIVVLEKQPCRLSFSSSPATTQTSSTDNVAQTIKLFLAPEIVIKPGSKMIVTQNGRMSAYKNSGQPAIYVTHQEIILELFRGWA